MVRLQVASSSVQYAKEPDAIGAKVLALSQHRADGFASGFEDRGVTDLWVSAQQRPQLLWNCEGDDEVLHWQKFRGLLGESSLGIRTQAVS